MPRCHFCETQLWDRWFNILGKLVCRVCYRKLLIRFNITPVENKS